MTLAAENLVVSRGGVRILDGVSLILHPGEVVGLLGANGAGKSTLLGVLAGDLAADEGRVSLDGQPLSSMSAARQARRRAVLPQTPALSFDLGVREVVDMGAYPFPEQTPASVAHAVGQAMHSAGVAHLAARRYPTLSGGEQQRVQFARTLVQCHLGYDPQAPRYLLLDEPTASLDPKHQIDLLAIAADTARQKGTGVLVILHDINLAAGWCDRLLLLAQGRAIAGGPPDAVLTPAHLRAAYGIEAEVMPHPLQAGRVLVLAR